MIEPERIVAAAVYHGVTFSLKAPARHHTILQSMSVVLNLPDVVLANATQGFLTSTGRFVNRVEAFGVAWRAKQLEHSEEPKQGPELFSEDLW